MCKATEKEKYNILANNIEQHYDPIKSRWIKLKSNLTLFPAEYAVSHHIEEIKYLTNTI